MDELKFKMSDYASKHIPFVFVIDFEMQKPIICPIATASQEGIFYSIKNLQNTTFATSDTSLNLTSSPISFETYAEKFNNVQDEINKGNSYLLNLTFPTEISVNKTLKEIFAISKAPYKLLFKDEFVVFSPECFVNICNDEIFTYPMKGTIDASIKDAEKILLNNKKEEWEHNTIVDLMRNDLSMVAQNTQILKYRYIDKIKTHNGEILQTSSEIKGSMPGDWRNNLGEIIQKLLPAGSISGAPKARTLEIIKKNELAPRGYYTGIFGIYDGYNLYSSVIIRYIERQGNKFFFKSGGGITSQSDLQSEYNELIQKIYVPSV